MCTRSWYQRSSISFTCVTWLIHIPFLCEHTPTHTLCTSRCIHNSHVHRLLISKIKSSNLKRHVCAMGHIRAIGHSQKLSCICTPTYAHRLLMSKMKSPLHTPTYTLSTSICIYISYVHRLLISKIGSSCTHMWAHRCAHVYVCVCIYGLWYRRSNPPVPICAHARVHICAHAPNIENAIFKFKEERDSFIHICLYMYRTNKWMSTTPSNIYLFKNEQICMNESRSFIYSFIYIFLLYTLTHAVCTYVCFIRAQAPDIEDEIPEVKQEHDHLSYVWHDSFIYMYLLRTFTHTLCTSNSKTSAINLIRYYLIIY